MQQQEYTHWFGPIPNTLPPDVRITRMDHALIGGLIFTLFAFILTLSVLWQTLPILGAEAYTLKLHMKFWMKLGVNAMAHGLFTDDAERYKHWLTTIPFVTVYGRLWVAGIVGVLFGGWIGKMIATPRDQILRSEGGQLLSGKDAEKRVNRITKTIKSFMYIQKSLGMIKEEWLRHILIYGGVGSGKTVILLFILKQIFQKDLKLILYDIKGDFTRKFPDAMLMSPWDRRSVVWDLARDIDSESAFRSFSNSIFPTKPDDKNKYFQEAAAAIMIAIIKELYYEHGANWGWHELNRSGARPCKDLYKTMTRFNPEQAKVIADEKNQAVQSVLGTFSAGMLVITQLATAWGKDNTNERFSFKEWLKDDYTGKKQIILQGGKDTKLQGTYIASIINALVPEIISPAFADIDTNDPNGRTLFFVFDEFPTVGQIHIAPLIELGRSKGCSVILGLQDLEQVKTVYGEEFKKSLPATVGTQIVCRVGAGETRQTVHRIIGKKRISTMQNNVSNSQGQQSVSTSYNEQEKDLLNESDITTKLGPQTVPKSKVYPVGVFIRSILLSGEKMFTLEWPVVPVKNVRDGVVEADWCMSVLKNRSLVTPFGESESAKPIDDDCPVPKTKKDKIAATESDSGKPVQALDSVIKGVPQAIHPIGGSSASVGPMHHEREEEWDEEAEKEKARLIEEAYAGDKTKTQTVTTQVPDLLAPTDDDTFDHGEMDDDDVEGSVGCKMVGSFIPGMDLVMEAADLMEGLGKQNGSNRKLHFKPETRVLQMQ